MEPCVLRLSSIVFEWGRAVQSSAATNAHCRFVIAAGFKYSGPGAQPDYSLGGNVERTVTGDMAGHVVAGLGREHASRVMVAAANGEVALDRWRRLPPEPKAPAHGPSG